jgi:uncharacterized membrane protein
MRRPDTNGPDKVILASFKSHDAAQHVVDVLARHHFPVEHVTIVGAGLRWQEQVVARVTLPRALLMGALTGGWIGLLIGLIFAIVSPWAGWALGSAILLGWLLGAIWAAIAYVVRRQAFAAVPAIIADRYDVLVDAEFAQEARRILTAERLVDLKTG